MKQVIQTEGATREQLWIDSGAQRMIDEWKRNPSIKHIHENYVVCVLRTSVATSWTGREFSFYVHKHNA